MVDQSMVQDEATAQQALDHNERMKLDKYVKTMQDESSRV